MLDLALFRIRNFAVTNGATVMVYGGSIGAFFYITLFLQQTAGYSAASGGTGNHPDLGNTVRALALVRQAGLGDGAEAADVRRAAGGGVGLLLLIRVGADAPSTEVLPGVPSSPSGSRPRWRR